jgi:EAL domain-containing protein (putative c-di-GMP-specific phosphodiesterase class I)
MFSWVPLGFDLERDLAKAADRGELMSYFQPQWDIRTTSLVAVEALCRWNHPAIGIIPPSVFIAVAEDTGAIADVGNFMIDSACELVRELEHRSQPLEVSLNMSAVQLETAAACDRVLERVRVAGINPALLTVEITESVHIDNLSHAVELLSGLRAAGIGVSIDDFGIGHSSRSQVINLPATEVKVDRSLVNRPLDEAKGLIREVVTLAKEHSLRVVAEGIETQAQFDLVRTEGCDRAQGFLLGRPTPRPALDLALAGAL